MRTNKLKNGELNTATLVRLRARLLKFTDDLPEHVRAQYKKNVCTMTKYEIKIPDTGPIAHLLKERIDSAKSALNFGFLWCDSPEGPAFWTKIYYSL